MLKDFYERGSTGGVASTLGWMAIRLGYVDGIVTAIPYKTIIARTQNEVLESCGSIYEDFPYTHYRIGVLGQIGKPCNLEPRFYRLRIGIFCSGTRYKQSFRVTRGNRARISRLMIPIKCFFCRDHFGRNADLSIGDTQDDPKENVVIVWTKTGKWLIEDCLRERVLNLQPITYDIICKKQPYLLKGVKHHELL